MGSLEEPTIRVLENLKAVLEQAGSSFVDVVKRATTMTNARNFHRLFELMEPYFTSPVASTGVQTGLLPTRARVAIEVIAVVPSMGR